MLDCIKHPLKFPRYDSVKGFEGQGNWAVNKYYYYPWRYFYRHKVRMIEKLLRGRKFSSIMDFGSGPGLLCKEWEKYSDYVCPIEKGDNFIPKVELAICASVLEFVDLPSTSKLLSEKCKEVIIASPMTSEFTQKYFSFIGDRNRRNSHYEIITAMSQYFNFTHLEYWKQIYFCARGFKR